MLTRSQSRNLGENSTEISQEAIIANDLITRTEKSLELKRKAEVLFEKENKELNDEQIAVVLSRMNPLLCSSEAGTGKTKTLIAKMIFEMVEGTYPFQMSVLSYTNTAKDEIEKRLNNLFQFSILEKKENFTNQRKILMAFLLEKYYLSYMAKQEVHRSLEELRYKKHILKEDISDSSLAPLLTDFENALETRGKADFTRLIIEFLKEKGIEWLASKNITHVFIDEFQDQTIFSFEIVKSSINQSTFIRF